MIQKCNKCGNEMLFGVRRMSGYLICCGNKIPVTEQLIEQEIKQAQIDVLDRLKDNTSQYEFDDTQVILENMIHNLKNEQ